MSPATLELDLPHGVAVAVAVDAPDAAPRVAATVPGRAPLDLDAALAALCAEERAHAAALTPVRRRDWVARRCALRAAIAQAGGAAPGPLLADDRGAPVLPAGVLGSVSHKAGLAVALATGDGAAAGWRVGVDVEAVTGARVDISRRILTDAELAEVAGLDGEARARAVALRFSIKEAVYKAIDPFVRRYVGFREVAVWPGGGAVAAGVATVDSALPVVVEAAWIELGDLWICSARARAR
ncbi:MAG: 4'-phosphopantetheinyl transferase superfamily protein [Kofleriaceae bacterium]|nr:4'-phosphopantetheinyl transferase superfamily protein [Kofleriaceae bacterium]